MQFQRVNHVDQHRKPSVRQNRPTQPPIKAELTGSDQCEALGFVGRGNTPVLNPLADPSDR